MPAKMVSYLPPVRTMRHEDATYAGAAIAEMMPEMISNRSPCIRKHHGPSPPPPNTSGSPPTTNDIFPARVFSTGARHFVLLTRSRQLFCPRR